jgi:hypothetical protein
MNLARIATFASFSLAISTIARAQGVAPSSCDAASLDPVSAACSSLQSRSSRLGSATDIDAEMERLNKGLAANKQAREFAQREAQKVRSEIDRLLEASDFDEKDDAVKQVAKKYVTDIPRIANNLRRDENKAKAGVKLLKHGAALLKADDDRTGAAQDGPQNMARVADLQKKLKGLAFDEEFYDRIVNGIDQRLAEQQVAAWRAYLKRVAEAQQKQDASPSAGGIPHIPRHQMVPCPSNPALACGRNDDINPQFPGQRAAVPSRSKIQNGGMGSTGSSATKSGQETGAAEDCLRYPAVCTHR